MKTVYGHEETALKLRRIEGECGIIPRTLSKKAIRSYFKVTKDRYKRIITSEILTRMGITEKQHRAIREYDLHQTAIIIESLKLTPEELKDLGRLM